MGSWHPSPDRLCVISCSWSCSDTSVCWEVQKPQGRLPGDCTPSQAAHSHRRSDRACDTSLQSSFPKVKVLARQRVWGFESSFAPPPLPRTGCVDLGKLLSISEPAGFLHGHVGCLTAPLQGLNGG